MKRRSRSGWLAACLVAIAWPWHAAAQEMEWGQWRWGELEARIDSLLSVSTAVRTQSTDCKQVATINGGCNKYATLEDIAAGDSKALGTEGQLLNQDDGNLNYDKGDWFSVLFKGTHDIQLDWRNYGAFVRFTWFGDALQSQADITNRTDLSNTARFRDNVLEGGIVGAHFLLLDAYVDAGWDVWDRYFNVRVGNQVINWGESLFAQGGLNGVNTLDVSKIRLAGSDLKEALLPAPFVKLAGSIVPNLGFELYYQFGWKRFDLDPVGTFFSTNDLVSRGAKGQFQPLPDSLFGVNLGAAPGCGDPGTPDEDRATASLAGTVICPNAPSLRNLTSFPNGIPRLGDREASDQGQFGAALRYYADPIETEFGLYFIQLHDKFPVVRHKAGYLGPNAIGDCLALNNAPNGPSTPLEGCDMGYKVIYPEDVRLVGASFNTLIAGVAVSGEFSYQFGQPTPTVFDNALCSNGNPEACAGGPGQRIADVTSLIESTGLNPLVPSGVFANCAGAIPNVPMGAGCGGGATRGYTRLDRMVGIINALYIFSSGNRFFGWIPQVLGANDMTFIGEVAVTSYPDLEQCPRSKDDPDEEIESLQAHKGCKRYPTPFGVNRLDATGWGYTLRLAATYDRIFGTPFSFLPVVSFSHDVLGILPPSEAGFNEDVMSVALTAEFEYLQRWSFQVSYANTFGAGIRNGDNDRDFVGLGLTYYF